MTTPKPLNPYSPDPNIKYTDDRVLDAVRIAYRAERTSRAINFSRYSDDWAECLTTVMEAADDPLQETPQSETTFALQLALRASLLCQQYDRASEIVARILDQQPLESNRTV